MNVQQAEGNIELSGGWARRRVPVVLCSEGPARS